MSEQLYQIQEPAHKKVNKTTAIGIDLGTTNSVVAYIADSKIKLVVDEDNSPLQPSVVNKIGSDGKVLEIKSIKRLMGKNYADSKASKIHSNLEIIEEDNRAKLKTLTGNYTAEEISAVILANLKSLFKNNKDEDLTQAVITVPAFFSDIERQATIKAAKIAGIEALRLINEPTAALLAYGLENNTKGNYVVYDLGGGTFDVSVLKLIEGIFQVKSTLGDVELGGDDFDLEISKHFNMQDNYDFFNIAKSLKHQLSTDNIAKETFEGIEYKLSENDFIQITKPLIDKTINIINKAIGDSQVEEINGIVLVGGSTKMPIIKKALSKSFNIEIFDDLNPETIVAKGAAIQADKLLNKNSDILLLDVNPISLGIETMGGIFERIIERNTPIPTSKGQNFSTFKDGQTSLAVNVYQGEREMVADNKLLGKLILKGIPTMPAGMPKIQISFMLDENSILKVKAVEKTTGVEQEITIESEISTEDSLKMLKDSIFNAKDDVNKREFTNSKVELEQVIQASKNLLNTNKLPQLEYNKLLSYVNEVESKLDTLTIKEDLDSTRLSLEDKFKEIVQDNMNELLAEKLIGEDLDSI